ncbi:MAG: hypothetical protein GEU79_07940 [Acidimicrobiia bacterium]|nr:hypothetical protein [Acidimicrobiia bacterium]
MGRGRTGDWLDRRREVNPIGFDLAIVVSGLAILVGASVAAFWFKRRMDACGVEVIGWMVALTVSNILQLVGIGVILVGFFG